LGAQRIFNNDVFFQTIGVQTSIDSSCERIVSVVRAVPSNMLKNNFDVNLGTIYVDYI
jgi:hypothetical protein